MSKTQFVVAPHARYEGRCLDCGRIEYGDNPLDVGHLMVAHYAEMHTQPVDEEDR